MGVCWVLGVMQINRYTYTSAVAASSANLACVNARVADRNCQAAKMQLYVSVSAPNYSNTSPSSESDRRDNHHSPGRRPND